MTNSHTFPFWTWLAPVIGVLALIGFSLPLSTWVQTLLALIGLMGSVLAAVYHAEVVAHRVGEPFGTLVLAIAVTIIEVALVIALMLSADATTASTLPRDTVFATVMIILNGIIGVCLLIGGSRFGEQHFGSDGVRAALITLTAIIVLTLVLPNFTTSEYGPAYSDKQLGFVALVSVILYGTFVFVQTVRHRDYFLPRGGHFADESVHAAPPTNRIALISLVLLLVCLVAVVLLGKALSPAIESTIKAWGAPHALVGVIIAMLVLLPEGVASLQAARANRLQTSLNLALGSALATIGLTIPTVAIISLINGWTLTLGIDAKSTVLLVVSLFIVSISLGVGRTTIMQGVVHLVIFATYLFMTIVP
jgi:Ca2+:H+ antiporter